MTAANCSPSIQSACPLQQQLRTPANSKMDEYNRDTEEKASNEWWKENQKWIPYVMIKW